MIDSYEMQMLERRLTSLNEALAKHVDTIETQNNKLEELTATLENLSDIMAGIAGSLEKIVEAIPTSVVPALQLIRS